MPGAMSRCLPYPRCFGARSSRWDFASPAVRPDQDPNDSRLVAMIYDIKKGTERGLREFLFPSIRDSYDDLLAVVRADGGADCWSVESWLTRRRSLPKSPAAVGLLRPRAVFLLFRI